MKSKNIKYESAKALAMYLLKLGKVSTDTACAFIYHQPKLPKALKRVKEQVDMSYLSGKITDYILKWV